MKITLTQEQEEVLQKLKDFTFSDKQVFVLSGAAGTGKTMLIKFFIDYLKEKKINPMLLASTGRAAKILSEKTGLRTANTVHKEIYKLLLLEVEKNTEILTSVYGIKPQLPIPDKYERNLYIVDESSMLSNIFVNTKYQIFGSGRLLTDFFQHVCKDKIIFVGDKCQLPPINTPSPIALYPEQIKKEFKLEADNAELRTIMRFSENSGIFQLTESLRKDIERKNFDYLCKWKARRQKNIFILDSPLQMVEKFVEKIKKEGIESSSMLCFTNKLAAELNLYIRKVYFSKNVDKLVKNELLMVVQNNYLHEVFNGDQIQIISVSPKIETRNTINFRDAEVQLVDEIGGRRIQVKIIENLLYSHLSSPDNDMQYRLFADFMVRKGNKLRKNKKEYADSIRTDPYLNALKVKYGYAITCHKAQGGEWKHVFVNIEKGLYRPNFDEERYRWMYTAYSRAMENLYLLDNFCFE